MSDVSVAVAAQIVTLTHGRGSLTVLVRNEGDAARRIILGAFPPRPAPDPGPFGVTPAGATPTGIPSGMPIGPPAGVELADVASRTTIERPLREIQPGETEQYLVEWRPDGIPTGAHEVRLIAYPADSPPEEYADAGQVVQVVAPAQQRAPGRAKRRWWLLALAVVLVLALGVVGFVLTRPSSVIVPGVLGRSLADAETTLRAAGLDVVVASEVGPEPLDTVIRQDPEEGAEVSAKTTVLVVVQVGFVLPDVTGTTVEDAVAQLDDVVQVEQVQEESEQPPGTVLRTDPAPGTEVPADSVVRLVVAAQRTVEVPGVIGRSADEASAVLEGLGLRATVLRGTFCRFAIGSVCQVVFQEPFPGTEVPLGTVVTLTTS